MPCKQKLIADMASIIAWLFYFCQFLCQAITMPTSLSIDFVITERCICFCQDFSSFLPNQR